MAPHQKIILPDKTSGSYQEVAKCIKRQMPQLPQALIKKNRRKSSFLSALPKIKTNDQVAGFKVQSHLWKIFKQEPI